MRALVVYESMFGNTHAVADAIGRGLARAGDVSVVPVERAGAPPLDDVDLVVVGGPTHVHGMSRASTRQAAVEQAAKADPPLALDADATGPGLREWLESLGRVDVRSAAFDTRLGGPAAFTGRASKGIAKRLREHGARLVAGPESFLLDKQNHLHPGEEERAEQWGARLAGEVAHAAG